MACCDKHDRMDTILGVAEYNDFPCGTPTNPNGEQRYCCRQCPSIKSDLKLKAVWASNPQLMSYLTPEEAREVFAMAVAEGSLVVDIQVNVPPPAPNAVTPIS